MGLEYTAHEKSDQIEQGCMRKMEIKAKRGTIYDAQTQLIEKDTTTYSIYIVLSKSAKTLEGKPDYLVRFTKRLKLVRSE